MKPETEVRYARELATYERHRTELERKYQGRIALMHGDELMGAFKTWEKAVQCAWKRFQGPEQCYWQEIGQPVFLRPLWGAWGPGPGEEPQPPPPPFEVHFAQELATYERHRAELERDHWGKFVVIRGSELIGVFKEENTALDEGERRFGVLGTFMLQEIGDSEIDVPSWIRSGEVEI